MTGVILSTVHESRRKPLARCVASIFALTAPTATLAATVTSCLDNGSPGTLRKVIEVAAEGGTVDFTGLDCTAVSSKITLSGTAITIPQNSLTIDGGGATTALTIDASALPRSYADSRIFSHFNSGTLTINSLTLTGGYVYHRYVASYGGCVASAGNVILNSVTVTTCETINLGVTYAPTGGAISTGGNLTLQDSSVTESSTNGSTSSFGGGVWVAGDLTVQGYGTVNNNSATADTGVSLGGGAYVKGKLTLDSGGLLHNSATSNSGIAKGGGAYVQGNVTASSNSLIKYNSATSHAAAAKGGGVYTLGSLTLEATEVSKNTVHGSLSLGGGAFVSGDSTTSYATIKYNRAYGSGALAGGLYLKGGTNTIASSTVSHNVSDHNIGGIALLGRGAGVAFELKNSTISMNEAGTWVGGVYADTASVKLFNSTIAFNTAVASDGHSPGIELSTNYNAMAANVQSTLISNNSAGSYQLDMNTYPDPDSVAFNGGNLGVPANNLIRATLVTNLPTDTKQDVCPHLGPLRDNGGLTDTHALMSNSEAIDAGNDSALGALYDQRGSAAVNGDVNYTRFSGLGALADIGAYEVQKNEIVFSTDFDDCPPLSF